MIKAIIKRSGQLFLWFALGGIVLCLLVRFVAMPLLAAYWDVPEANLTNIESKLVPAEQGGSQFVKIGKVSKWMCLAILAAEDHRFYEHHGIDSLGILRAGIDNVRAGRMVEGASTISQQLAKIAFLDQEERTARRKLSQLILAVELEDRYSKEQILEAYLNTIYFGSGAYGIESAAKTYFGVSASALSIAQSAFLAGVVRAPSLLGDKRNRKDAVARQQQVIQSMLEYGYITREQAVSAEREVIFKQTGRRSAAADSRTMHLTV